MCTCQKRAANSPAAYAASSNGLLDIGPDRLIQVSQIRVG